MHHNHSLIKLFRGCKNPFSGNIKQTDPSETSPFAKFPFLFLACHSTNESIHDDLCIEKGKSKEIAHFEKRVEDDDCR